MARTTSNLAALPKSAAEMAFLPWNHYSKHNKTMTLQCTWALWTLSNNTTRQITCNYYAYASSSGTEPPLNLLPQLKESTLIMSLSSRLKRKWQRSPRVLVCNRATTWHQSYSFSLWPHLRRLMKSYGNIKKSSSSAWWQPATKLWYMGEYAFTLRPCLHQRSLLHMRFYNAYMLMMVHSIGNGGGNGVCDGFFCFLAMVRPLPDTDSPVKLRRE